jgi:hypothetical protein
MEMSEQINDLSAALSAAQSELNNPVFDAKNPHFKSMYASLASVRNAIVPVFSKHGLSIIQDVAAIDGCIVCVQMLLHKSGQWIKTTGLKVPCDKQNAHGYGSATTYARRFSLMALACVVGDDDDDGNAISINSSQNQSNSQANQQKKVEKDLDWAAKIQETTTLEDLAAVWIKIPKIQQEILKELKDKKKIEFSAK